MINNGLRLIRLTIAIAIVSLLVGCAVNPVTGKKELSLVSEQWELDTGKSQYAPLRQAQGGDYVVDSRVEAYVQEVGNKLAAVSDRKLPYEFNVINSSVPNAWALPGGKISINRGLLTQLESEAELAAVLGHEIVHAAARHGAKGAERNILFQSALIATSIAVQGEDYGQMVQMGAGVGVGLVSKKYGRDAEREADRYGVEYMVRAGYDPQGAVRLQEQFVKMAQNKESSWFQGLFASHPASQERVENNRQLAAQYPAGGVMGKSRYQQVMTYLNKKKPAYESFDKARTAYKNKDLESANTLVNKAIKIEPKESDFHAFAGDIDFSKESYKKAEKHFDQAISLNNDFFYYYLRRGLLNQQQERYQSAEKDLKRSNELLPTPVAYNALGDLAQIQGKTSEAKSYYAKVANQKGVAGKAAYNSLVKLDLPTNPGKYLQVKNLSGQQGQWIISITNPTPVNVESMLIRVRYPNSQGLVQEQVSSVKQLVKSGQTIQMATGLRINSQFLNAYEVDILKAKMQ